MTKRRAPKVTRARPGVTLVTNNVPSAPFSLERFKDGTHGHKLNWLPGMSPARMQRYILNTIEASRFAQTEIERMERAQRAEKAKAATVATTTGEGK